MSTPSGPGGSALPPSLATGLPPHLIPAPFASGLNTTRILLLKGFDPSIKTKDIQEIFEPWQDLGGGHKIKWNDDVSCWIVFNDPVVAKKAFLSLNADPPPALQPSDTLTPKLVPYTGPDVAQILSAVQNRPRSRSINGGHSRKTSALGSGSSQYGNLPGAVPGNGPPGSGHGRSQSFGRNSGARASFGQKQMQDMMEEGEGGGGQNGHVPPPVPAIPDHLASTASRESAVSP